MVEVVRSLDTLHREFESTPHLLFTEHDLHSRLYHLIQEGLGAHFGQIEHGFRSKPYTNPLEADHQRAGFRWNKTGGTSTLPVVQMQSCDVSI